MAGFIHLLDQRRLIAPGGSTIAGNIFFYYTGTSVKAPIFLDASLTIPMENPVPVGAGEPIPSIYLDQDIIYRRVIEYADGTYDETDPIGNLFSDQDVGLPVGAIIDYSGPTAPDGFLFCAGQAVSRSVYSDLFNAVGTLYGPGNGTTTFNLPDYRGRVTAGKDNMGGASAGRLTGAVDGNVLGASGGASQHVLTEAELAEHNHQLTDPGHQHTFTSFQATGGAGIDSGNGVTETSTRLTQAATTGIVINPVGESEGHNNIQPTIVANKIIKVTPVSFLSLLTINPDFTNKANAMALGILPTANDMGEYINSLLTDNVSAKQNIEELADAILSRVSITALASALAAEGAGLVGYLPNLAYNAGTVGRRLSQEIYVTDYGAIGNNVFDNTAAFSAATAAAIAQGKTLRIPRGSYVLGAQWLVNSPIDIVADPSCNLRWTNATSAGLLLDFRAASANFGLNVVRLGGLYSPSVDSTFNYPGYPSSWTSASRSTQDAVTLRGGSRIDIHVQYAMGWNAEFRPQGTYDTTNGARAPLNVNYFSNTGDINTYGVYFDGGPANAASLGAIYCEWNTCFAKFPVFYAAATHSISQCNVRITGQCFTNEAGGAVVFGQGANINTCTIDIPWVYAGYSAYDSPTGTSTSLTLPLVAGDVASNGQSTDGNATVGYFAGSNNTITVGLAIDQTAFPGGRLPVSGAVTRIRNAGSNNQLKVNLYEYSQGTPATLGSTQGEANYGGGIGAAAISRCTLVNIPVPLLTNAASVTRYFYHTFLSDAQAKAISIVPANPAMENSKLSFSARDNASNVNRECILEITNTSGADVAAATYSAWLVVH